MGHREEVSAIDVFAMSNFDDVYNILDGVDNASLLPPPCRESFAFLQWPLGRPRNRRLFWEGFSDGDVILGLGTRRSGVVLTIVFVRPEEAGRHLLEVLGEEAVALTIRKLI